MNAISRGYNFTSSSIGGRFLTSLVIVGVTLGILAIVAHFDKDTWNPIDYLKNQSWGAVRVASVAGFLGTYILIPKSTPQSSADTESKNCLEKFYDKFSDYWGKRIVIIALLLIATWLIIKALPGGVDRLKDYEWQAKMCGGVLLAYLFFGARELPKTTEKIESLDDSVESLP